MTDALKLMQPFAIGILFALLYAGEHIFPQRAVFNNLRHDGENAIYGVVNLLTVFTGGYFFQQILSLLHKKHIGLFNVVELPVVVALVLQVICIDVFMYWWHRLNHAWPFLWRFHRLHHQDEQMNVTTALRFHLGELFFSYLARILVFPLLGIGEDAMLLYGLFFFPIVMLHHSNICIGRRIDLTFRKLMVSPGMHRIHHSRIRRETNSNYGSVFPWWDAIFRTYRKQAVSEIHFGLDKETSY